MLAEIHNVTKSYRSDAGAVPVLNGISLTIAEGETVAITGPSGCGKSVTADGPTPSRPANSRPLSARP